MTLERPGAREAGAAAGALSRALEREASLLDDLTELLRRQRAALAADRGGEVEASVDDLGRLLQSLDGARRATLELESLLPAAASWKEIEPAIARTREAALAARSEAALNTRVLGEGLAAGERFLQTLFQSIEPEGYGPADGSTVTSHLVDRRG